jgi:hypothetical protein
MGQRILYTFESIFFFEKKHTRTIYQKKVLKPGANEASAQEPQNAL